MERKLIYESKGKRFAAFFIFGLAFIFIGSLAVMLLWNAVLPAAITGANKLTYWQAMGLLALSKILFGGFKGKPEGDNRFRAGREWREKFKNMTPEEREKLRNEWRERCGRRRAPGERRTDYGERKMDNE